MENELMIVNNNEIELTKEGIKFIKKVQKAKVAITAISNCLHGRSKSCKGKKWKRQK